MHAKFVFKKFTKIKVGYQNKALTLDITCF